MGFQGDSAVMATKKTTTKAAADTAATPDATAEAEADAKVKAPTLKIRDLVRRVAEASGAKRKDAKALVEAKLAALGESLAKGEDFNLPGLGRMRIARTAEKDGASHLTLKVKRGPHKKKEAKEPLADEEDDG